MLHISQTKYSYEKNGNFLKAVLNEFELNSLASQGTKLIKYITAANKVLGIYLEILASDNFRNLT